MARTRENRRPAFWGAVAAIIVILISIGAGRGQQEADPEFNAAVERPAYTDTHPKVLFDEAHNNFHTPGGRYKPFADLVTNDGYRVSPNKAKFSRETLSGFDILVIANALGAALDDFSIDNENTFSEAECEAVRNWVASGGALLLIADHAPAGRAAARLASHFGVDMSQAYAADPVNYLRVSLDVGWIVYSRPNGGLGEHPILRGRDGREKIGTILAFAGQSLKGPAGSVALLRLSDEAYDILDFGKPEKARVVSAAGRSQAVALEHGKGRVVVFGEAAMLSAQDRDFGMNYPGFDNRQLVLNVMHWLSNLL